MGKGDICQDKTFVASTDVIQEVITSLPGISKNTLYTSRMGEWVELNNHISQQVLRSVIMSSWTVTKKQKKYSCKIVNFSYGPRHG